MTDRNWGGKREGAGRKPIGPTPLRKVSVTLPVELVQRLERLGNGNVSQGIRRLWAKRSAEQPFG